MIDLQRQGAVFVLTMNQGENRMNADFLRAFGEALDEVEGSDGPAALVTTGEGKFYSNGIDLEWLMKAGAENAPAFVNGLQSLLARVLVLPVPTIAAINGHAFAGGGMLALSHDFRVMRTDRGYFCLPEVDIQVPFTPAMSLLIREKLHPQVAHRLMVTGARVTASEALEHRIVDEVAAESDVLPKALELATELASKDRTTLGTIKSGAYAAVAAALRGSAASPTAS